MASRLPLGRELIDRAMADLTAGRRETSDLHFQSDTWSSPFSIAYLNVGRRHLIGSLPEIAALVKRDRPDILFLGDLVTARHHIGRLRKGSNICCGADMGASAKIDKWTVLVERIRVKVEVVHDFEFIGLVLVCEVGLRRGSVKSVG